RPESLFAIYRSTVTRARRILFTSRAGAASICERSDHAALLIGGSFAVLHMRTVAASQHASPHIRNISSVAIALKAVRIPKMKSSNPMLKNQLFQSHAENRTAPPERR